MKYFLDTEFHEYKKKPLFGKAIDTIELISIGIVNEDDNKYYAICKEFDLEAAWNSYQWKDFPSAHGEKLFQKEYWLRENVLKPIFDEYYINVFDCAMPTFNYKSFKYLINKVGKTKDQIVNDITHFICDKIVVIEETLTEEVRPPSKSLPEFYAYYADYDWVVFCWLFGRMIDLPKEFPMYCRDLKQILDEKGNPDISELKKLNKNAHNALDDARWNKKLYEFLNNI